MTSSDYRALPGRRGKLRVYDRRSRARPARLQRLHLYTETSRPKDEKRAGLYARLGIRVYWLVDLHTAEVVKYSLPTDGVYETTQTLLRGQLFESTAVDGLVYRSMSYFS